MNQCSLPITNAFYDKHLWSIDTFIDIESIIINPFHWSLDNFIVNNKILKLIGGTIMELVEYEMKKYMNFYYE